MINGFHAVISSENPDADRAFSRDVFDLPNVDPGDRHAECGTVSDEGWGLRMKLKLPGGGTLGVYQPRHARPGPAL